ncbi:receptor-like protein EIX2 isoform X1 [Malus domestica]|uniref:receptor-like protein EIX2 isoform X1 n=2 Tax=Malus domestica TaxID=3750 RepID=UPI0010AAA829|nr:receptor-like protein EIX2 isoform X1 [Malus domestica]
MDLRNPYPPLIDVRNPDPVFPINEEWTKSAYVKSSLGGKINASLLSLKHLNYLDLSYNYFDSNQIPKFFGELKSLQYLNLSHASFGGEIPLSLGNLSSLNFLDLSSNFDLSSRSLNWLSRLSSMKYLDLGGINLSGTGVNWVYDVNMLPSLSELRLPLCFQIESSPVLSLQSINLTSLLILDLSDNMFTSAFPSWLFNLTSLITLDISINNFNGPFPSEFANFKYLEHLDLSETGLKGRIPKVIGNLCKLKFLSLSDNKFDGGIEEFWRSFSNCPNNSLESLDLSNCELKSQLPDSLGVLKCLQSLNLMGNNLWGSIPDFMGNFSSLKILDLSDNNMTGSIPQSLGQLSQLVSLHLAGNSWEGNLTEAHFINLTRLQDFQLGCQVGNIDRPMSLIFDVAYDWVPPFQLHRIVITNCWVGHGFWIWLQSQTELVDIFLNGNGISDSIPKEWLLMISSQLIFLDLSNNQFHGNLPSHLKFPSLKYIDLSRNQLEGLIPHWWSTTISVFNLGSNLFSGSIPSNIGLMMPNLGTLTLYENNLSGTIPPSVWNMQQLLVLSLRRNQFSGELPCALSVESKLVFLDVGLNNLSGNIPSSLGVLSSLKLLKLNNNNIGGEIPDSLQNCSSLMSIDLGDNKLSGNIPLWIGGSHVPMLSRLLLRSNYFSGHISQQLCNLRHLHILDLSYNNLSGIIPMCLGDLIALVNGSNEITFSPLEQATLTLKGFKYVYNTTLDLVKSIDLSLNNLQGEIPEEISSLILLGTLNLSRNKLTGNIPSKIGNLHWLETLDLSHNHLSGQIPQSFSSLTSLSHLNLSCNNLSGRIISGNQLQTLDDSSIYTENPLLCGAPLSTKCSGDDTFPPKDAEDKDEDGNDKLWFYATMVLGYIVGFWGVCGTLILKTSWRYAYFQFFDNIKDKIALAIALKVARFQRMFSNDCTVYR